VGGLFDEKRRSAVGSMVEEYSMKMARLCTALVKNNGARALDGDSAPPAFYWLSLCDGGDYISSSLHYENYMCQLLAFCFHLNGALHAWTTSVREWEAIAPESRDEAERLIGTWAASHAARRRDVMFVELRKAIVVAERAEVALSEWEALRAYTRLRYPPELSREFAQTLRHLALFFGHHIFVENASAGLVIIDDTEHRWISPIGQPQISASSFCRLALWQSKLASVHYRVLLDHPRLSHLTTAMLAITAWSLRAALYHYAYAAAEREQYRDAFNAVAALHNLDWSEPESHVPRLSTVANLETYITKMISKAPYALSGALAYVKLYDEEPLYYGDYIAGLTV
jgi:hypothetical protein